MGFILNGVDKSPMCIVYYCSGHGYGHATRVSAFTRALLSLDHRRRPSVHIVSSAPQHVFSDSIACGALYRYAEIDPVVVQPLAYQVDRRKSVEVLKSFLGKKEALLDREKHWLCQVSADAVLSDAAFLGCMAAKAVEIPSILITNFSFDAVFSYLSTPIIETPKNDLAPDVFEAFVRDEPVPSEELDPLVEQILAGYRCADMLVRLPGYIPLPSFFDYPSLPASQWVDEGTKHLRPKVANTLLPGAANAVVLPPIPFPHSGITIPRRVIDAPLIVRTPSSDCYTPQGRSRILGRLGVPADRQDLRTKVLVVSFGGQAFHQPSRSPSGSPSRNASREDVNATTASLSRNGPAAKSKYPPAESAPNGRRLATESHLWVPGAPPAYKAAGYSPVQTPRGMITVKSSPMVIPTVSEPSCYFDHIAELDEEPLLLPDDTWIAVVCGVSKEQWLSDGGELPDNFYVAPKNVYMPDLTAVADVLLGKLGYGTVSECIEAQTPFVYVSRPLFVEEHGLRILLEREGVGLELSRSSYESGDWASAISQAWKQGRPLKESKRLAATLEHPAVGVGREYNVEELAKDVVDWVSDCRKLLIPTSPALL